MDAIREQLNRPLVAGLVGLVAGIFFGLVVLGWWLWPVKWTDADPTHLRTDLQEEYLRMAIDSYTVNQDLILAKKRWDDLGEKAPDVLASVQGSPGSLMLEAITAYRNAVQVVPGAVEPGVSPEAEEAATPRSALVTVVIGMCIVTVLLGLAFGAFFLLRGRGGTGAPVSSAEQAATQAEWTDYAAIGEETPMVQFMASYKIGDDLFDDSFSIDSPSGEFLGECGVGISEPIGVGDPKKVTAFEVWLFDKNDIQTVTKVLMSTHAFEDEAIRHRLEAKGEPVLAAPGNQMVLETATLRLVSRIIDMSYGEGALPEKSFFDSLVLELAVWQK